MTDTPTLYHPNPKRWNKQFGFWKWKCGCIQYQDGFDLCPKHQKKGYRSLLYPTRRKR